VRDEPSRGELRGSLHMALDALFRPGQIGSLSIKNRVVKSPQTTALSNQDGTVTERLVNHYRRLAEGGVGLIIVEYTYVDDDASKSIHAQLGISRREHIPGLGWLVDEVHAAGAKVGIQLEHCGRQKFLGTAPIKSASDSSWDYVEMQYGRRPTPMTSDEIAGVVSAFGDAAQRAYLARFDLVEIHAGHGYLITNFLSPFTNQRTDSYGGSFENRRRLLLEIVADVRAKVPADFPVSVRLSVTDYEEGGIAIEETVELSRLLQEAGVDVIHASGGHHAKMEYEVSPWFMPRAVHRWGWQQIRDAVTIPVIASGSLVRPELANEILQSGEADFVSLGRAMLADPDWTLKAQQGRLLDIVPCIRCNDGCLHSGLNAGRSTGCTVNPSMGAEYRHPVEPAASPKRVAVVGSGPAGLRAADVLARREHEVTLYERDALGGHLAWVTRPPRRQDLAALRDHLIHTVSSRSNIKIVHAEAGLSDLVSGGYDAVVIATGTVPRSATWLDSAPLPVINARDITDPASVVGPVVIIGGGMTGVDLALWLSGGGVDVTIIEAEAALLSHDEVFSDAMTLPALLAEAGVKVRPGHRAIGVTAEGVEALRADGATDIVPAATVVAAIGYDSECGLRDQLRAQNVTAEVATIGGAARLGRLMNALHDAFFVARRI
jgi:2,4-dienoyl-CoA reductase-like NADH-dependent reductase (Old Yellow Enzyme family)/thioredoxin reductase